MTSSRSELSRAEEDPRAKMDLGQLRLAGCGDQFDELCVVLDYNSSAWA